MHNFNVSSYIREVSILSGFAEKETYGKESRKKVMVLSVFSTSGFEDRSNMTGDIRSLEVPNKGALQPEDNIPKTMVSLSKTE